MTNNITVSCQYSNGAKGCGNKTTSPTGLCTQHRNSVPLKDIHAGTRKKPLMSAIPRVGPVITNSASYTTEQPTSNEELVERLEEGDRHYERDIPPWYTRMMAKKAATPAPVRPRGSSDDSSAATAMSASATMDAANASISAADIAIGIF